MASCISGSGMKESQLVKPSNFMGLRLMVDKLISQICIPGSFEVPLGIHSMILCYESSNLGRWTIDNEIFTLNVNYRDKNK